MPGAKRLIAGTILAAAGLLATAPARAQAPAEFDPTQWTYAVTLYGWFPNVNGDFRYERPGGGGTVNAESGPSSYLEDLRFAFFLAGEARRDRWSIFTDFNYLNLDPDKAALKSVTVGPSNFPITGSAQGNVGINLKGAVWTLVGGYTMARGGWGNVDAIGGFRYLNMDTTLEWSLGAQVSTPGGGVGLARNGSVTGGTSLWNAVAGVRGRILLGEGRWYVPYYLDVGTGDSNLTWQGMAGIGYSFGRWDLLAAYKYLSFDQGSNGPVIQKLSFGGPAVGVTFRF